MTKNLGGNKSMSTLALEEHAVVNINERSQENLSFLTLVRVKNFKNISSFSKKRVLVGLCLLVSFYSFGMIVSIYKKLLIQLTEPVPDGLPQRRQKEHNHLEEEIRTSLNQTADFMQHRPTLILHVGPPKTATTTIQHGLRDLSVRLNRDDNVQYYHKGESTKGVITFQFWPIVAELNIILRRKTGRALLYNDAYIPTNHSQYRDLMKRNVEIVKRKITKMFSSNGDKNINQFPRTFTFLRTLNQFHKMNSTVIMSIEQMCYEDTFLLIPFFEKWNVRVVVTYRRYFEWITSKYYQEYVGSQANNHRIFETISSFVNEIMKNKRTLEQSEDKLGNVLKLHPTFWAATKYSFVYSNVRIFNYHDSNYTTFMRSFVCEMVPEAVHTCAYLSSKEGHDSQGDIFKRKSSRLDYMILAVAFARQENLEIPRGTLLRSSSEIGESLRENRDPLPLSCVAPNILQQILSMSLLFEEHILPEWHNIPGVRDSHFKEFANHVESLKFCDVDYEKALKDQELRSFFEKYLMEREREINTLQKGPRTRKKQRPI